MIIEDQINYTNAILSFLKSSYIFYPNFPADYTTTQPDILIHNFTRYGQRTTYYASNFASRIKNLLEYVKVKNYTENCKIPIEDNIFWDFDAFIFSCKSIFEKHLIENAKHLSIKARNNFFELANREKESFINKILNPIRIEIVHINNYGSSIGSLAEIIKKENETYVRIDSNFIYNDQYLDLIELFFFVFNKYHKICFDLVSILLLHLKETFGNPNNDIKYNFNGTIIKFTDFTISENGA